MTTFTLQNFAASADGPPDLARFTVKGDMVVVESNVSHKPGVVLEQLPVVEARRLWAAMVQAGWVEFKLTPHEQKRAAQKAAKLMKAGMAA